MQLPSTSTLIESLSPSRLERLACPARVAFEQLAPTGHQGLSTAAAIGQTIHLAMEQAVAGASALDAWDQSCAHMASKGFDPAGQPNSTRTRARFERALASVMLIIDSFGPSELRCEQRLVSADGSLEGTPDLVLLQPTRFRVLDYKNSLVLGEGQVLEKFAIQLEPKAMENALDDAKRALSEKDVELYPEAQMHFDRYKELATRLP